MSIFGKIRKSYIFTETKSVRRAVFVKRGEQHIAREQGVVEQEKSQEQGKRNYKQNDIFEIYLFSEKKDKSVDDKGRGKSNCCQRPYVKSATEGNAFDKRRKISFVIYSLKKRIKKKCEKKKTASYEIDRKRR